VVRDSRARERRTSFDPENRTVDADPEQGAHGVGAPPRDLEDVGLLLWGPSQRRITAAEFRKHFAAAFST
jgi:hypothetical protein